jgi:hypothetical protein
MLDFVESRFNAIGLKPELGDLKVVRSSDTPEVARVDGDQLILAETTLPKDEMLVHITKALGFARMAMFTDEEKERWNLALIHAAQTRVQKVKFQLSTAATATNFNEILDSIDLPVTKLLAIHLFNALIAGGMSFANAKDVDFDEWGSTSEMALGHKPFSLIPLLGAYAPRGIATIYSEALADLVCNGLNSVTHSDVRSEFSNLIVELFNSGPLAGVDA